MRMLTTTEQRYVLKSLPSLECLDYGSSRVVFNMTDEMADNLGFDTTYEYVIKLAVGIGGFNQQLHELNFFMEYGNEHLATIVGYGQFFIIMEKVQWIDLSMVAQYADINEDDVNSIVFNIQYDYCPSDDEPEFDDNRAARTILFLTEILGTTSDNGQLGLSMDGRVVAYDYGFIPEEGTETQCSYEFTTAVADREVLEGYTDELCRYLDQLEALNIYYTNSDKAFQQMASLERDWYDN